MIAAGRDRDAFEQHLNDIETKTMSGRPHRDRAAAAAKALCERQGRYATTG